MGVLSSVHVITTATPRMRNCPEQHPPNGTSVKAALRPLRGRAPPDLDPDAYFSAHKLEDQENHRTAKTTTKGVLTGPAPSGMTGPAPSGMTGPAPSGMTSDNEPLP
ncbi:MAG: hypothetical protein WA415_13660 [Mycobacterium sp.]